MLHLIPPPLHRAGLRLAHRLRKSWWRWRKPEIAGVSVIVRNGQGHVLLVRHSYERLRWTLPGGGLGRGELPEAAAARELAEELGWAAGEFISAGVNERLLFGARCLTHVFACEIAGHPTPDGREVIEAQFFHVEEMPPHRSPLVDAAIALLEQR